jgi:hypothetical protein
MPIRLLDTGDRLRLAAADDPLTVLQSHELGEQAEETRRAEANAPDEVSLAYLDPARDYQAGLQRARRPGAGGGIARLELPAVVGADKAKGFAETALAEFAALQVRRRVSCGWSRLGLAPGTRVSTPDGRSWRVAERSVSRNGVSLELALEANSPGIALGADPGRGVSAPDDLHGPTIAHLLDLPPLEDTLVDAPRLFVAAAGSEPGWRRAALLTSIDGGASWTGIGDTAPAAVIGTAATKLPGAPEYLLDTASRVDIMLANSAMTLSDADPGQLAAGANLALLGDELIQFGEATPLSSTRWRLERLVRGRRGTDWAADSHAVGERFVLLLPDTLLAWDPPLAASGSEVQLLAAGLGDTEPVAAFADAIGAALKPPAPAQLRARQRADGGFDLSWSRSSRLGWRWLDGVDAPLGEEREAYRLTITRADGSTRTHELTMPIAVYPAAEVTEDRAIGPSVTIAVIQLGTRATSRAALLTLPLA